MSIHRVLFILVICLSSGLQAAPFQTPGDRDLIRDRQDRLLQEQQKRLEELQQLPGKEVETPPQMPIGEGQCVDIHTITLEGANRLTARQRQALIDPFLNRCLGTIQLNELLKAITSHYLDRGYVTSRAYLPQQDLTTGELSIIVIEGNLEGIDESGMATSREIAMAFPGLIGESLNLRELEQLVDQLSRLPSRNVQLEIEPGETVGGSRVQLKGQRDKPWRISATRNNDGDRSTGEQQMGLGFDWDSPLGLGDQLSIRANQDAVSDHWRHSSNQSLYYSLPWGWWTFSYSYSQSYYRTRSEYGDGHLNFDGTSKNHMFRAERLLHRDNVSKTSINTGLSHLRTRNYIDNLLIDVSSTRLSEFQLGFNHGRRIGNAFFNLDLSWHRGIGAFDAQGNDHHHGSEPNARYNKYMLTASYLQPFQLGSEHFTFDSFLTAQKSEDVLYSPQRISLGGISSIRGFKDQTLYGDTGGYWRSQLRWRRPVTWEKLRPWVHEYGMAVAYDLGIIHGDRYNEDAHGRMSGTALEFSLRGQYFAASVTFAHSLERPDIIDDRERPIYFRFDAFF